MLRSGALVRRSHDRKTILVLSAPPFGAAATRFRACAYFPYLREAGFDVDFRPFLTEAYFEELYRPGHPVRAASKMLGFAAKRLTLLLDTDRYDAVFVQREATLVGPPLMEWFLARRLPVVFDMDDPLWLEPPPSPSSFRARHQLLGTLIRWPAKADALLRVCSHAIVASNHLATYARTFKGDAGVTLIPTVVSHTRWLPRPGRLDGDIGELPVIGWIGTHSTAVYLDLVRPALRRLARDGHRFVFRVRGALGAIEETEFEVQQLPWRLESEAADFAEIDIGLAPLFEDEWSEGKAGFKQLQYLAVGVPMVTSLVGGVRDFIRDGENALVASTEDEWYANIKRLLVERETRAQLARRGREIVEKQYSVEAQADRFVSVFRGVLGRS